MRTLYDMATLDITHELLIVRFTLGERIAGLLGDITVPRDAITAVTVEEDAVRAVSGLRAPGLALPGRRKIGTWRGFGDQPRRTAVSVAGGEAAVRITLEGQKWDQLLIGTTHAHDVAARLAG